MQQGAGAARGAEGAAEQPQLRGAADEQRTAARPQRQQQRREVDGAPVGQQNLQALLDGEAAGAPLPPAAAPEQQPRQVQPQPPPPPWLA